MDLDNIWMFSGETHYSSNPLMFFAKHIGMDFNQFTALTAAAKRKPEIASCMKVNGDVATVNITGVLAPLPQQIMEMFGGTSTTDINDSFQRIINNPRIKGVFMNVDSPGGNTAGIDQAAAMVHQVRKRIPVVAQVSGTNASAAYYVSSQANKVFASNRTNQVGSIGTRLVIEDDSKMMEKIGIKTHVLDTGPNKSVGHPGVKVTEEHIEYLQNHVNQLNGFFEQSVKRGRPDIDISQVNDGSVWLAQEAERRGLIDGTQTPQETANLLSTMMRFNN